MAAPDPTIPDVAGWTPQDSSGGFQPDLSSSSTINPDGTIAVPGNAQVNVFGRTMSYNEAIAAWWSKDGLSTADRNSIIQNAALYYNRTPADILSYLPGYWQTVVTAAATNNNSVGDELTRITQWSQGAGSTAGGATPSPGAPYGGTSTSYQYTTPQQAKSLVDQALTSALGRAATADERAQFMEALRQAEDANPTTVTVSGSPSNSTRTQSGGIDPAQFALDWASGQEGAGEYKAATQYLDTFLKAVQSG